jgi:PTH1 family peptidyl-tRNA hydrolase
VFIIVGLGNPGPEYHGTRHNIGFAVVEALAEMLEIGFLESRGDYMIAWAEYQHSKFALVKPLTYMNNSGIAVKEIVKSYNVSLSELLVISDDFHLPLGTLRLRLNGSDGGHNGLSSIIYQLESEEFSRMRCGIASALMPQNKDEMAGFVLAPFDRQEYEVVRKVVLQARDAALEAAVNGVPHAMNRFNTTEV